jgi:diguanylate cyclase (GGDEF)-like protein
VKEVPRAAVEAILEELRGDRTGAAFARVCEQALARDAEIRPGAETILPKTLLVLDRLLVGFLEHPGTAAETRALVALTRVRLRTVASADTVTRAGAFFGSDAAHEAPAEAAAAQSVERRYPASEGGLHALIARGLRVLSETSAQADASPGSAEAVASTASTPSLSDEAAITGLPDEPALLQMLATETDRAQRFGQPLTLAVIVVQHLDAVRERFGQEAGAAVLRAYADQVLRGFRTCDVAAHLSAAEFAVMFPHTPADGGARALAKVREIARQSHAQVNGNPIALPDFSGRPVEWRENESAQEFLARARAATRDAGAQQT